MSLKSEINSLKYFFPGRDSQIDILYEVLHILDTPPKILLLHGPQSTGKTGILLRILNLNKLSYILIDCHTCYSQRSLLNIIMQKLIPEDILDDNIELWDRIRTFWDLIRYINRNVDYFSKFRFIVFKNYEHLNNENVQSLLELARSLDKKLYFSLIFVSKNAKMPLKAIEARIFFPRYNKEQLIKILMFHRNDNSGLFRNFVDFFLDFVHHICKDLHDLKLLVDVMFNIYIKPVKDSVISSNDQQSLIKNLSPYLKADIYNKLICFNSDCFLKNSENLIQDLKLTNDIDLPVYSKFLLVAAYLASFVSPKHDVLLFCKQSLKKKKKLKKIRLNRDVNSYLKSRLFVGPRSFTLNRLLAIFFSISKIKTNISAHLLSQISSLVELKLLAITNKNGEENPNRLQYKCIANLESVRSVARNVKFSIDKYLDY